MYYRSLSSSSVRRLKPSPSSSSPSSSPSSPTSPSSPSGSSVEVVKDRHGVDQALIKNLKGYSVRVSLYGAQVLSWMTDRGEEILFTSSKATFKPPKAYRGGIPICFPQFGNRGTLEQHGFARNSLWTLESNPPPLPASETVGKTYIDFLLKSSDEHFKIWPHVFEFRLRVALGPDGHLHLISRIRNIDTKPFSFSFAFHTYLAISDIGEVRIEGLETYDYLDNLHQRERFTDQGNSLTFESETDRIYVETPNLVAILDHERRRTYYIRKEGLPDFVVWNPWDKKSKAIPDFGDEDYKKTLCVDGSAIENPIVVKPNEEWTGKIELFVAYRS